MISEATTAQWTELIRRALKLSKLDPWNYFRETDFLRVESLISKDSYWVSFADAGESGQSLICAAGQYGLCNLLESLCGTDAGTEEARLYGQDSLAVYFACQEELTPYDIQLMKVCGAQASSPGDILYFRRLEPGYVPWTLTGDEVMILADLLANITSAAEDYISGKAEAFFPLGNVLARRYDKETGEWTTQSEKLHIPSREYHSELLRDELLLARLRRKQLVDARLELDVFRLPVPLDDDAGKKPFYPGMALIADEKTGQLVEFEVFTPDDSEIDTVVSLIMGFIEKYGRPLIFYVQNRKVKDMLGEVCRKIGIPVRVLSFLSAINSFKYAKGISRQPTQEDSLTK